MGRRGSVGLPKNIISTFPGHSLVKSGKPKLRWQEKQTAMITFRYLRRKRKTKCGPIADWGREVNDRRQEKDEDHNVISALTCKGFFQVCLLIPEEQH